MTVGDKTRKRGRQNTGPGQPYVHTCTHIHQHWYHHHCMDIPSEVFDKEEDIYWECKACCAKDTPAPLESVPVVQLPVCPLYIRPVLIFICVCLIFTTASTHMQ